MSVNQALGVTDFNYTDFEPIAEQVLVAIAPGGVIRHRGSELARAYVQGRPVSRRAR